MTDTSLATSSASGSNETKASPQSKRNRILFAAILLGLSIAVFTVWYNRHWKNREKQLAPETIYSPMFNSNQNVVNPAALPPNETPESMLKLAKEVAESGLHVYGVSQCGWTVKQREMFGDRNSEARKIFEKTYIECTTRDMCPDIKGYPSWKYGLQVFPGFKTAAEIRTLVASLQSTPKQQMLHMPSEPMEENLPEEKHTSNTAPDGPVLKKQQEKRKKAAVAAKKKAASASAKKTTVTIEELPSDTEVEEEEGVPDLVEPRVEKIRGVSDFPPLNVPDMPGTAPMALAANNGPSHATDQFLQGNRAPLAVSNPHTTPQLSKQMAQSMEQVARDQQRDVNESTFTKAMLPQSATITRGDPFSDKSIPRTPMKNP